MSEYDCYFFGPDDQPGAERVYAAARHFQARTDDEARMKAYLAFRRLDGTHAFEIWQAGMLVYRHAPPAIGIVGSKVERCG
jgi:hypothetical protein